MGNASSDALVWSPERISRRLGNTITCYPEDCFAEEGDEMYVCAQQGFCAAYRETEDRQNSFWQEMDKDTEMVTKKLALHWGGRIAMCILVALAIGAFSGILVTSAVSLGAAGGNRCCQRVLLMKWRRHRQAKVAVAAFVVLVLLADAIGAYFLVRSGANVSEDVNAGVLASGLPQLLHGFMECLPALNNPTDKYYWTLMLDNPTKWDIVLDKLTGISWLQDMPTTKIHMINAPRTLASSSTAAVNMSAGVYAEAIIAVAKTAATYVGGGTLYVGIGLWVEGKFNEMDFGFGSEFRLPLDTSVEGFPGLSHLIKHGIEDAVLYSSLESGLRVAHSKGEVIMQVETLKFEGEFVRRAILFGLLICGTIGLAAWCGSVVCCSALLRDREPRTSIANEAKDRVERLKKAAAKEAAAQEKAEEGAAHAAYNQQPQFACSQVAPQQYGMMFMPNVQPVYPYQAAQATYFSADVTQVHIQMDADMQATTRDKE